ncbi:glycine-rich RNA-binding, abscisic acid-inducible protein [Drosophila busckii]|uniref:glycine-rich RNA-binding, abscisic acid-inducible protein n=1 Tax=Drosophila busckii TaxID=30019 RepID=UPI001432F201|nr:glycine-rich RNA-binding, abscisic acid-inducible protein [Drosophila busckii]
MKSFACILLILAACLACGHATFDGLLGGGGGGGGGGGAGGLAQLLQSKLGGLGCGGRAACIIAAPAAQPVEKIYIVKVVSQGHGHASAGPAQSYGAPGGWAGAQSSGGWSAPQSSGGWNKGW